MTANQNRYRHFKQALKRSVAAVGSGALMLGASALANPKDGTVVAGSATITQPSGTSLVVNQTSSKAVINWGSFNIGNGDTTSFNQPSTDAITLNRVTGGDASEILGALKANGQVWLINSNGIVFGKNARVNVGGLLATTLDIMNDDFLAGNYRFNSAANSNARVVNQGNITVGSSGLAALVAPGVENSGSINARLGYVVLGSTEGFTLDFYGDGKINFLATTPAAQPPQNGTTPVKNTGTIIADGGKVTLAANTASGVVNQTVNTSGVIEARSVGTDNGDIVLSGGTGDVAVSGNVDASGKAPGATGGEVEITGRNIALNAATIDTSGGSGGGKVLIGGDYHGGNPDPAILAQYKISVEEKPIPTANTVTADTATSIDASATKTGDGGKVVVWSNMATNYAGSIAAKGGTQSGNGGFAEVSGVQTVAFTGTANLSAPHGISGTILFDPASLTIDSAIATGIQNTLNTGTDVEEVSDSIYVQSNILKTAGSDATLTLTSNWLGIADGTVIGSTSGKLNVVFKTGLLSLDDYNVAVQTIMTAIANSGATPGFFSDEFGLITTHYDASRGYYETWEKAPFPFVVQYYASLLPASFKSSNAYQALSQDSPLNFGATAAVLGNYVQVYTNGGSFSYTKPSQFMVDNFTITAAVTTGTLPNGYDQCSYSTSISCGLHFSYWTNGVTDGFGAKIGVGWAAVESNQVIVRSFGFFEPTLVSPTITPEAAPLIIGNPSGLPAEVKVGSSAVPSSISGAGDNNSGNGSTGTGNGGNTGGSNSGGSGTGGSNTGTGTDGGGSTGGGTGTTGGSGSDGSGGASTGGGGNTGGNSGGGNGGGGGSPGGSPQSDPVLAQFENQDGRIDTTGLSVPIGGSGGPPSDVPAGLLAQLADRLAQQATQNEQTTVTSQLDGAGSRLPVIPGFSSTNTEDAFGPQADQIINRVSDLIAEHNNDLTISELIAFSAGEGAAATYDFKKYAIDVYDAYENNGVDYALLYGLGDGFFFLEGTIPVVGPLMVAGQKNLLTMIGGIGAIGLTYLKTRL